MSEDMAEGDTRDDLPGEAGGQIPADDQGLSADRTGMVLPPGLAVKGRFIRPGVGRGRRLAVGEEGLASGVGVPFGAGIQAIVAHDLRVGRRHMLQRPRQELANRQRLALIPFPSAGRRVIHAPPKTDRALRRVLQPGFAQGDGCQIRQLCR